jgi:hypothetical protein
MTFIFGKQLLKLPDCQAGCGPPAAGHAAPGAPPHPLKASPCAPPFGPDFLFFGLIRANSWLDENSSALETDAQRQDILWRHSSMTWW